MAANDWEAPELTAEFWWLTPPPPWPCRTPAPPPLWLEYPGGSPKRRRSAWSTDREADNSVPVPPTVEPP